MNDFNDRIVFPFQSQTDNIDDLFSSLSTNAAVLNQRSDECNKALKDAQERLVSLNIGLEYWLKKPIHHGKQTGTVSAHETHSEIVTRLGFTRLGGNWCFATNTVRLEHGFHEGDMSMHYTCEFEDEDPEYLLNASRELRLAAVKALPEFLREYNRMIQELNAALEKSGPKEIAF